MQCVISQVIFKQLELVDDEALHRTLFKKMAPPLVTLLSAEPEIQYVALRNINLIVQKYPTILAHEVKVRAVPRCTMPSATSGTHNGLSC